MMRLFCLLWLTTVSCVATVNISDTLLVLNNLRAMHNAPPVQWDLALEKLAFDWANTMDTYRMFEHSSYLFGENLAYYQGVKNSTYAMENALLLWYSENKEYNYSVGGLTAGHFTQLVWKSTKYIGAAFVNGYVVMEFNPPGNHIGRYIQNVLPSIIPSPPPRPPPPPRSPRPPPCRSRKPPPRTFF